MAGRRPRQWRDHDTGDVVIFLRLQLLNQRLFLPSFRVGSECPIDQENGHAGSPNKKRAPHESSSATTVPRLSVFCGMGVTSTGHRLTRPPIDDARRTWIISGPPELGRPAYLLDRVPFLCCEAPGAQRLPFVGGHLWLLPCRRLCLHGG